MPFENSPPRRRIAVIGAGISGMGAAYRLSERHDVTLIESEPRLGGHARTVMAGRYGDQAVDTGFIVFNYANYPNMARLFAELDVPVCKSQMSFAASLQDGAFEYGLDNLNAMFGQRRNALSPKYLRMLRDIVRFNAEALHAVERADMTVGELIAALDLGDWFRDRYLLPLSGAIWSTPKEKILDFPAAAMVQFFDNHALLHHSGQHQWYTVMGGSIEYVRRLEAAMAARGVDIRLNAPVAAVRRNGQGAEVKLYGDEWMGFDEVIFATHADDSLRLLEDPSGDERAALGQIRYQPNDIVLHADQTVMPKRRRVWSAWNYAEAPGRRVGQIDLTYWMNALQPIPMEDPMFVTLNSQRPIDEARVYDHVTLRHPVYDRAMFAGQAAVRRLNGAQHTWFCGAWMRDGFHEDGLTSGLEIAAQIEAEYGLPLAAE
ncbi:cyclopropane-fatty-acyl-phospholipid synthase [Rhodobacterales bacterium 59_46_T64]|nr:cyclopropane-fatty-acyl-phospholipid synthase [Rhodobacterales bacterium 59_46_T64]